MPNPEINFHHPEDYEDDKREDSRHVTEPEIKPEEFEEVSTTNNNSQLESVSRNIPSGPEAKLDDSYHEEYRRLGEKYRDVPNWLEWRKHTLPESMSKWQGLTPEDIDRFLVKKADELAQFINFEIGTLCRHAFAIEADNIIFLDKAARQEGSLAHRVLPMFRLEYAKLKGIAPESVVLPQVLFINPHEDGPLIIEDQAQKTISQLKGKTNIVFDESSTWSEKSGQPYGAQWFEQYEFYNSSPTEPSYFHRFPPKTDYRHVNPPEFITSPDLISQDRAGREWRQWAKFKAHERNNNPLPITTIGKGMRERYKDNVPGVVLVLELLKSMTAHQSTEEENRKMIFESHLAVKGGPPGFVQNATEMELLSLDFQNYVRDAHPAGMGGESRGETAYSIPATRPGHASASGRLYEPMSPGRVKEIQDHLDMIAKMIFDDLSDHLIDKDTEENTEI